MDNSGLEIHRKIHNDIMYILTKESTSNSATVFELEEYLNPYFLTESRGILRTILTTLKPTRKLPLFKELYDRGYSRFVELGGKH
jgi:hypothetical protein